MRTVGVEEELLLIDATTGEPRSVAIAILASAGMPPPGPRSGAASRPTPAAADRDRHRSGHLSRRAEAQLPAGGARRTTWPVEPAPASPHSPPHRCRWRQGTVKSRYQAMTEHFGLTASEQLTCGCHVHVGVESPRRASRSWTGSAPGSRPPRDLGQFAVLAGENSGYASFRSQAWNRCPALARPASSARSRITGAREDAGRHRRTAGPRHGLLRRPAVGRYPTVELRVADVCLSVADTVLIASLARALVETAVTSWRHHAPAPTGPTGLIRMANWRAARSGLDGKLLDPLTSRPHGAADVVATLLQHVRPALVDAGDLARVTAAWVELVSAGPAPPPSGSGPPTTPRRDGSPGRGGYN